MARARTPSTKSAQARYEKGKLATGEHIQINVKLKAAADVAMMEKLRARFGDLSDPAIARLALRELAGKGNRK